MKREWLPYAFLAPSLIILLLIIIFPLIFTLRNSFINWNLMINPNPLGFVGFRNFRNRPESLRPLLNRSGIPSSSVS